MAILIPQLTGYQGDGRDGSLTGRKPNQLLIAGVMLTVIQDLSLAIQGVAQYPLNVGPDRFRVAPLDPALASGRVTNLATQGVGPGLVLTIAQVREVDGAGPLEPGGIQPVPRKFVAWPKGVVLFSVAVDGGTPQSIGCTLATAVISNPETVEQPLW